MCAASISTEAAYSITTEILTTRWKIGLVTARDTLSKTTQLGVRDKQQSTMNKRFKLSCYQLKFRHVPSDFYFSCM